MAKNWIIGILVVVVVVLAILYASALSNGSGTAATVPTQTPSANTAGNAPQQQGASNGRMLPVGATTTTQVQASGTTRIYH